MFESAFPIFKFRAKNIGGESVKLLNEISLSKKQEKISVKMINQNERNQSI